MMTADKKLKFIHQMTKLGMDSIPHYGLGGAVSNILGTNNTFQAAQAPVQSGTNQGQLVNSYSATQEALENQNNLANQAVPGATQASNAQSALSNQLGAQALGQGPNPAQAALNQSTGQNIAAQAALQASQRGAAANPGAVAAQVARQGADIQQQAVGQAATLQAQQQIAAQQQQGQLAAQQIAQAQGSIQGQNQFAQNEQNILQGSNTAYNNALTAGQGNANSVNAQAAIGNQQASQNAIGAIFGGASAAIGHFFADGGEVHRMAEGGYMAPTPLTVAPMQVVGPQSAVGQFLNPSQSSAGPEMVGAMATPNETGYSDQAKGLGDVIGGKLKGKGGGGMAMAGGPMDAGGPPIGDMTMVAAKGGKVQRSLPMMYGKNDALIANGGKVKAESKGQKAVSDKDDYANDKVPALLSEGEVVIDKNTLNDPGPIGQMARQVANHISMRNTKGRKNV